MSTATQTDAEHAWHILVSLVMESRGDWRRKISEATGMPFSRYRALKRLRAESRTLRDLAEEMRSEEHTSELQSLMRISYAVFCLKKKRTHSRPHIEPKI